MDENVPQDESTAPVAPEPEHDHKHHEHEDGELSPLCIGGGCVTKTMP